MILITRPEKEANELAQILINKEYSCLTEPMLEIKYLQADWQQILNEPVQSFIATSKHGRRFAPLGQPLAAIPKQGKNASELSGWIIKNLKPEKAKLVYLRGETINFDMAGELKKQGFKIEEVYTYQTTSPKDFSLTFFNQFAHINTALFFSAQTLNNFLALADKNKLPLNNLRFICISAEVAEELKDYNIKEIHISDTPDLTGMINKLDEIY